MESEGLPTAVGHRGTVLVIEDSLESAALLSTVLKEEGFRAVVRYDGIGVRIEDDVLITAGEPKILSAAAPRAPKDIEAFMAKAK